MEGRTRIIQRNTIQKLIIHWKHFIYSTDTHKCKPHYIYTYRCLRVINCVTLRNENTYLKKKKNHYVKRTNKNKVLLVKSPRRHGANPVICLRILFSTRGNRVVHVDHVNGLRLCREPICNSSSITNGLSHGSQGLLRKTVNYFLSKGR